MKTFGILALGGAMGIQFEDLSYNNLREAFMEVSLQSLLTYFVTRKNKSIFEPFLIDWFRLYQKFMVTKISIPQSSVTTTFHISNGATQMEMEPLLFLNQLDVDQNQDSGTHHK